MAPGPEPRACARGRRRRAARRVLVLSVNVIVCAEAHRSSGQTGRVARRCRHGIQQRARTCAGCCTCHGRQSRSPRISLACDEPEGSSRLARRRTICMSRVETKCACLVQRRAARRRHGRVAAPTGAPSENRCRGRRGLADNGVRGLTSARPRHQILRVGPEGDARKQRTNRSFPGMAAQRLRAPITGRRGSLLPDPRRKIQLPVLHPAARLRQPLRPGVTPEQPRDERRGIRATEVINTSCRSRRQEGPATRHRKLIHATSSPGLDYRVRFGKFLVNRQAKPAHRGNHWR